MSSQCFQGLARKEECCSWQYLSSPVFLLVSWCPIVLSEFELGTKSPCASWVLIQLTFEESDVSPLRGDED